MNSHNELPPILLTGNCFSAAQREGIRDISVEPDIMQELSELPDMPDGLPDVTVLRVSSFSEQVFDRARPNAEYFSAAELSGEQEVRAYQKAQILGRLGTNNLLEVSVTAWDESALASDMVDTLYRIRSNNGGISEPVTKTLRNFGKLLNRLSGDATPVIGAAEKNRGNNLLIARQLKPYRFLRNVTETTE